MAGRRCLALSSWALALISFTSSFRPHAITPSSSSSSPPSSYFSSSSFSSTFFPSSPPSREVVGGWLGGGWRVSLRSAGSDAIFIVIFFCSLSQKKGKRTKKIRRWRSAFRAGRSLWVGNKKKGRKSPFEYVIISKPTSPLLRTTLNFVLPSFFFTLPYRVGPSHLSLCPNC